MKNLIVLALVTFTVISASAGVRKIASLKESESKINVHQVADSIVLGENKEKDIKVRLVSEYLGQSSDVSPRKNLYITFFHGGEMMNTATAFSLGPVWSLKSTRRVSAGVYEITFEDLQLQTKKMTVDTTQIFIDDSKLDPETTMETYFHSVLEIRD